MAIFWGVLAMRKLILTLAFMVFATAAMPMTAQSIFPMRPDDARAVYLERGALGRQRMA